MKLTISLSLLREASRTLAEMKKSVEEVGVSGEQNSRDGFDRTGDISESKSLSEFATPKSSEDVSFTAGEAKASDTKLTELYLSTDQVVLELALTSSDATDTESEKALSPSPSPTPTHEVDVSLQGEALSFTSKPTTKEGLMLTWQNLMLTVPPADKITHTSEMSVDDLQLLSIVGGLSSDLLSPTHLSCLITRHKPTSRHDL